jgi:hypothetical protein
LASDPDRDVARQAVRVLAAKGDPAVLPEILSRYSSPANRADALELLAPFSDRPEITPDIFAAGLMEPGRTGQAFRRRLAKSPERFLPPFGEMARAGRMTPQLALAVSSAMGSVANPTEWKILGPVDMADQPPVPPDQLSAPDFDFSLPRTVSGRPVGWKAAAPNSDGFVDLERVLSSSEKVAALAVARWDSSREEDAELAFSCDDEADLWLNGQPLGHHKLGQNPRVKVRLKAGANTLVVWSDNRGGGKWFLKAAFSSARPDLPEVAALRTPACMTLFDDEPSFVSALRPDGPATITLDGDRFSGSGSVKVVNAQASNPWMPGWRFQIAETPQPGQYRYIRFAWKKNGGDKIYMHLAANGEWKHRLYAGRENGGWKGKRISDKLPGEWTVVTRDLFKDFGSFTMTGLALSTEGGTIWADCIQLARSPEDFPPLPGK